MNRKRAERGFALLLVLWTLSLLALLLSSLLAEGRSDLSLATNLRAAASAEAAADGALAEAIFHLLPGTPQPWQAGPRTLAIGAARVRLLIGNEGGKVNPNLADPTLLTALLGAVGADPASAAMIAQAIVDWRGPELAPADHAALMAQYLARGRATGEIYLPPGEPFENLDEVGLVLGMTPALRDRLRPHLSLATLDDPAPALADPAVAAALAQLGPAAGAATTTPGIAFSIEAYAETGGARFTRRAVVRIGATQSGRAYAILAWDQAP